MAMGGGGLLGSPQYEFWVTTEGIDEPCDHNNHIIAAQLSHSLIMDIPNDVTWWRSQWVVCKDLHRMSFGSCDHNTQIIAAQLSHSLIMDIPNDVTWWRSQWVVCKDLHSMSFGSPS
eukprot:scaffold897_cov43-Cyclotella_meneghiniana.AAC.10